MENKTKRISTCKRISVRYHSESGYREVLVLAIPLIFGHGAIAIQQFVDRMFLAWYSPLAIAAVMPSGVVYFTIMSLFMGTANYVSTFVAQYHGAGQTNQIGSVIWQGMYLSIFSGLVLFSLIPFAASFFSVVGHSPEVQKFETIYFQLLCFGAGPATASAAMSGFFTGRGKTLPVMWVNFVGVGINIFLNYIMIFGKLGLPEMGVFGAGLATLIATFFTFLIFIIMVARPCYEREFSILSAWRPDFSLISRLIRFALPNGIQFTIEHIGFSAFILLVGRIGTVELAATNIAFNISMLAFMPMMGFGMAVTILVGQSLGKDRPDISERCVYSGMHLMFFYMLTMSALYVFIPGMFIWPFSAGAEPGSFVAIEKMVVSLLKFIAVFSLFDTLGITFSSGIKGAGDTRFVMIICIGLSIFGLTLPTYIALVTFQLGLYAAWAIITIYIAALGVIFLLRFLGGKWKSMRVIETDLLAEI